jgi:hypothetical protein
VLAAAVAFAVSVFVSGFFSCRVVLSSLSVCCLEFVVSIPGLVCC